MTASRRAGVWLLTLGVLVVGLVTTTAVSMDLRARDTAEADRRFAARTELVSSAVEREADRYVVALELVAGALASGGPVTGARFAAATEPMGRVDFEGATSVAFLAPYLERAEVRAAQQRWRQRGATGLVLEPTPGAERHVFAVFSRPLDGSVEGRTGIDVSQAVEPFAALQEAERARAPRMSRPYVLLIDQDLPEEERQASFSLVIPVLGGPDGDVLRGWVLMGIRGQDLMGGLLDDAGQGRVSATLSASAGPGVPAMQVARTAADEPIEPADDVRTASRVVQVAQTAWTVDLEAAQSALVDSADTAAVAALGGTALSTALAALVHLLAAGRSAAQVRIAEATAELAEAEADSRRQAAMLAAVLESIGDGVGVVDGDGTLVVHNPAGKALLGVDLGPDHPLADRAIGDVDDPDQWADHYGLFDLDGRRIDADDLPLVRALRGEHSDGQELVVRNPARPEGTTISVTARPLDPASGHDGAVAVFRDVTAERQRRAELTAFAGVVAHDLRSPLTAVDGYLSLLGMTLDSADCAECRVHRGRLAEFVGRAAGAAARMHLLIQGLLDYVTARDAAMDRSPVDLHRLVEEVVETYREKPQSEDTVFTVDVPSGSQVLGDAARLRQVLDNLVGNAVKYADPDRTPEVSVVARHDGDRLVLEVSDRGLGIPQEELAHVFEPFRRAHGGDVSGSGLGLAICHSVVTRHDGTIAARRRPGGGTTVALTLSAASAGDRAAG